MSGSVQMEKLILIENDSEIEITLADLEKEKLVLFFYPKASTPG